MTEFTLAKGSPRQPTLYSLKVSKPFAMALTSTRCHAKKRQPFMAEADGMQYSCVEDKGNILKSAPF